MRVVVTGIGLVTPLGADRETSWRRLHSGAAAPRWLDDPAFAGFPHGPVAGAPAAAFDPWESPPHSANAGAAGRPADCATLDPVVALAWRAACEALADARFEPAGVDLRRLGCVLGTSKGGLRSFERIFQDRHAAGSTNTSSRETGDGFTAAWRQFLPNAPAAYLAGRLGLQGPLLCPVAACATGLASLARGADLIRHGHCDAVLAGSADASLLPAVVGSFRRLGVLARAGDDPASACRPFDRNRSGFVVGEGAAVLVFERSDHAAARGAVPYAEWIADASAADAAGLTQMEPSAEGLTWLFREVLRRATLPAAELDYINLHGTGTVPNDRCETRAVRTALGRSAGSVRCSSLKGALGHLLGAAGSVETALTLLALRDGIVPPTANLREPDPECDLDYTPLQARRQRIGTALKLSLGFGGHLVAAVLRNLRDPEGSR